MMVKRPCSEADVLMVQDMLVFAGVLAMPLTAYEQGNAAARKDFRPLRTLPLEQKRGPEPGYNYSSEMGGRRHLGRKNPGRKSPGPPGASSWARVSSISCRTRKTGRTSSQSAGFWRFQAGLYRARCCRD